MAPSFGIMSIIAPPSGVPPAVIMARMPESCSAVNASVGGLPAASINSNRSPMRTIIALGKREKIRTLLGIGLFPNVKTKGGTGFPVPPLYAFFVPTTSAEQAARLNLDARSHGGGNRDALDVGALGAGRFCLGDRVRERLDVLHQLFVRERRLADAGLHDSRFLDAEFDRTALGALDGVGDVHSHRADLRVRHHAARSEHLTQPADPRHHVGGRDAAVEIDGAP